MKTANFFDRLGIVFSGLCAVHCVAVPALLFLAPLLGSHPWFEHSIFHKALFFTVFLVGAIAIYLGYRIHSDRRPVILLTIGLLIVFFATFFAHDLLGHTSEFILNPIGGVFLIAAHYSNHTRRHRQEHKDCSSCKP